MVTTDKVLLNDWHPVVRSEECEINSIKRIRLLEEDLVLWRSNNAESAIQVWQDRCPHRGAPISLGKIVDDRIVCGYHGWQYNTTGKCVHIPSNPKQELPADAQIKTYQCQERYGLIWVCLGEPAKDIAPFPEWDDSNYRKFLIGPYKCQTSPFRAFDNGIDLSHVCFVHDGLVGDSQQTEIGDYELEVNTDGITISDLQMSLVKKDEIGVGGKVTYQVQISHPLTLYMTRKDSKGRRALFYTVTPVSQEECISWTWATMDYGHETPDSKLHEFNDLLFDQDAFWLESLRPVRLPLLSENNVMADFPPEIHAQCDSASIAYRRWLKDLGITFGVC